ncbi:MAG: SLC13 family permease [Hyphomicrobiales bacterium]
MTYDIAVCLGLLVVAVGLFAWDRLPVEVVALGLMLAVVLLQLVPAEKAFGAFGSSTTVTIFGLLIMTAGLAHTGVVDTAGRYLAGVAGRRRALLLPVITGAVALLSAFTSNTAATAFFVPVVIGLAAKSDEPPSRYLLPLAFASILTSSVTLISTSTNIVVSELLTQSGQPPMGMFELAPVGIPISIVGLIYLWVVGVRLLKPHAGTDVTLDDLGERHYQVEVVVLPDSPLAGRTIANTPIGEGSGLAVGRVMRGGAPLPGADAETRLEAGDVVLMTGLRGDILKVKNIQGIELKADAKLVPAETDPEALAVVEAVLLPGSPLIGRTLKGTEFHDRYGLQVLGLNRLGQRRPVRLSRATMRLGDVLLLQGRPENVKALEQGNLFNIFGGVNPQRLRTTHAPLAAGIFAGAIALASFTTMPIMLAVMMGAFAMLATRCITPEEAYRRVEWKVLVLISALLGFGMAMETTGTGAWLAQQLLSATGNGHPLLLLALFFVVTVAITQPMSNQVAAVLMIPVALATARTLGLSPRPFAMMIAIAAITSYLTPLEPSCLLVYGPGKYRFADFFKVGAPLTILIFAIAMVLVPLVWPFTPG